MTNDGWIPVSERLPKNDKTVLVCFWWWDAYEKKDRYVVDFGYYIKKTRLDLDRKKGWHWCGKKDSYESFIIENNEEKVIAWMPKPEPMKKEES